MLLDKKDLKHCSECGVFPCDRLVEWAKTDASYGKGFTRLEKRRAEPAK